MNSNHLLEPPTYDDECPVARAVEEGFTVFRLEWCLELAWWKLPYETMLQMSPEMVTAIHDVITADPLAFLKYATLGEWDVDSVEEAEKFRNAMNSGMFVTMPPVFLKIPTPAAAGVE